MHEYWQADTVLGISEGLEDCNRVHCRMLCLSKEAIDLLNFHGIRLTAKGLWLSIVKAGFQ